MWGGRSLSVSVIGVVLLLAVTVSVHGPAAAEVPSFSVGGFHRALRSPARGTAEEFDVGPSRPTFTARLRQLARETESASHPAPRQDVAEWPASRDEDASREAISRLIQGLNSAVTENVVNPLGDLYLQRASPEFRDGLHNALANLREPITLVSSLAQGKFADASVTTARFAINSTYGILGIRDRAQEMGFPQVVRTVEEALCAYDLPTGPYLVLPFFGPSTGRDLAGRVATMAGQYLVLGTMLIPYRIIDSTDQYLHVREQRSLMLKSGGDPYETQKAVIQGLQKFDCHTQTKLYRQLFVR
ncbi:MAG: MlaA family lipoprotein [Alphaproteobacteria bacterium]